MCQVERVAALDALILKGGSLRGLSESVRIPSRFNGPLESGNGGYSAGVVAAFVDGIAEVSIIDVDGRKRRADAAVLSCDGEPLAVAQALLVEPRTSQV